MSDTRGGTRWELQTAWDMIIAARDAGDDAALELGWRRYSEGLKNSAIGAAGGVLIPLDNKITELVTLFHNARTADLDWRTEERTRRDAQSDRIYTELNGLSTAIGELARGLGGLERRVTVVEKVTLPNIDNRLIAVETQGAPAKAVDELHLSSKRIGRLEVWVAILTIAIAANALIYLILAISGGGR